ncbi:MAG: alpha/beta fold hydrolase [Pseudohongiellaceae bacterium]
MRTRFVTGATSLQAVGLCALLLLSGALFAQNDILARGKSMDSNVTPSPINGVTFRTIQNNGISMRIAEAGTSGPLILFAHGWPESWYGWRHQLTFFAEAGYRVVAPDMRGYGKTEAPKEVTDYDIVTIAADMTGILDVLGEEQAIMVGHDWGAIVAWNTVLLHPDRFTALVAMSVPYGGRPPESPMDTWRKVSGENFHYILYHNEPGGVAEAEYDANPVGLLSRLYLSPDSPRHPPLVTDHARSAGGWIDRLGESKGLPDWLSQNELDYVVSEFEEAGFRGGMNYYRNFHRNWEITEHLQDVKVKVPTVFIAGADDMVIAHSNEQQLQGAMSKIAEDFRGVILFPGVGHWVQQEVPDQTNRAILDFLNGL